MSTQARWTFSPDFSLHFHNRPNLSFAHRFFCASLKEFIPQRAKVGTEKLSAGLYNFHSRGAETERNARRESKLFQIGQSGEDLFHGPGDQNPPSERSSAKKKSKSGKAPSHRSAVKTQPSAFLFLGAQFAFERLGTLVLRRLFEDNAQKLFRRAYMLENAQFGIRR